jgi:hypothetical protein
MGVDKNEVNEMINEANEISKIIAKSIILLSFYLNYG